MEGMRGTSAMLAAIFVAGLILTSTADADATQYDWRVCPGADDQCEGAWAVYPEWVQPGEKFKVHVDFDEIVAGFISEAEFWVLYQPSQLTFRDAGREQTDPGSPVACEAGSNTGGYLPVDCPDCIAQVHCSVADWFFNGGLDIVGPAEVELEFTVKPDHDGSGITMVAPDWFFPRDENGNDINGPWDGLPSGPMGVLVYVPEPGEMAMLAAGLLMLPVLSRRRNRRS